MQPEFQTDPLPNVFTACIFGEDMKVWINSARLVSFRLPHWQHESDMEVEEFVGVFGSLECSNGLTLADNLPHVER